MSFVKMYKFLLLVALIGLVASKPRPIERNPKVRSIKQRIDNNAEDSDTFNMKYYVNQAHYKEGGPLILLIYGSSGYDIRNNFIEELARTTNAYLVQSHTRLQQRSNVLNKHFLTTEQILADLAHLVKYLKVSVPGLSNSKVIAIGISLYGSFASWFRQKYPELCDGAWAADAPVLAKANYHEYYEHYGYILERDANKDCFERLQKAYRKIGAIFESSESNVLVDEFELCHEFSGYKDENVFLMLLTELITIKGTAICNFITDRSEDEVGALAKFTAKYRGQTECFPNSIFELVEAYKQEAHEDFHYLMCNELGWFRTTTGEKQPFAVNLNPLWYSEVCSEVFGAGFTYRDILEKIDDFNDRYGGLRPNASNIYFTIGEHHPFRPLAVQRSFSESILVDIVKGVDMAPVFSHITDDYFRSAQKIQVRAKEIIQHWIKS